MQPQQQHTHCNHIKLVNVGEGWPKHHRHQKQKSKLTVARD